MKVTGLVLKIDTSQKDRAIKIDVQGAAKPLWVPPELHPQIRDLKEGQEASFEVADTMRWYYVFRSWERASAPKEQDPPESPTQTEKGPEPPKTEITVSEPQLPDNIGELKEIVIIAEGMLSAKQAELDAVRDLPVAARTVNRTLQDGWGIAEFFFRAQAKLGELLKALPPPKPIVKGSPDGSLRGTIRVLPEGISKKQSHFAQRLAKHPELIAEIMSEAKERKDLPSWSQMVGKLRALTRKPIKTPPLPKGKYQTIVIDPPWNPEDEGDVDQIGRAQPLYPVMPLEDIAALKIPDLAAENAHIYLWITNRSLPKGFDLLTKWGFRYITALTWIKPSIGIGQYFRGSTEHVLFGVKGSLPLLRNDVGTHFSAKRPGGHSAKPDEFYDLIETCSPEPRIDMFGGKERKGWTKWGEQHDSN
jgi:N6-adenosine-specific RNA methylase IME4